MADLFQYHLDKKKKLYELNLRMSSSPSDVGWLYGMSRVTFEDHNLDYMCVFGHIIYLLKLAMRGTKPRTASTILLYD